MTQATDDSATPPARLGLLVMRGFLVDGEACAASCVAFDSGPLHAKLGLGHPRADMHRIASMSLGWTSLFNALRPALRPTTPEDRAAVSSSAVAPIAHKSLFEGRPDMADLCRLMIASEWRHPSAELAQAACQARAERAVALLAGYRAFEVPASRLAGAELDLAALEELALAALRQLEAGAARPSLAFA